MRLVLDALGGGGHTFAGDGGLIEAARQTLEQMHANALFQRIEPAKSRRMIDVQGFRGTRQASFALNRQDQPQFVPVIPAERDSTYPACSHASAISKMPMSNA